MTNLPSTDIEKENLEAHVALCAQRYESLDKRLTKIEDKVSGLQKTIEDSHQSMTRVIIGTAGTIITAATGILFLIMTKMP